MFKEFREFALKGNLTDTAIAFVMGVAFGKVISAFIDGMVMPLVGLIQGKDFSNLFFPLSQKVKTALDADPNLSLAKAKELGPVFAYGTFITVCIEFLVIAFVMFLIIKAINASKKKEAPAAAPEPSTSEKLLVEIRDALRK